MGFADSLLTTYSQGYKEKLAASRDKEDRDREIRVQMAMSHAKEIEADDTLSDEDKKSKLRDIYNVVGEDTGYKHDPKIFGLFHPHQPGHKGMAMGDALFGPAQTGGAPLATQGDAQPQVVTGTQGENGAAPAVASSTPFSSEIQGGGNQVFLQPPPSGQTLQAPTLPGSTLTPPPSDKTLYPPGYTPDTSSRAGRKESAQVRAWWVEHQGQVDLIARQAAAKGFTEKLSTVVDGEDVVTTMLNPVTGESKEFRSKGVPATVVAANARAQAQADRKVNQEVAVLKNLPQYKGMGDDELKAEASKRLENVEKMRTDLLAGRIKWQGGMLTQLTEARKILSDPNSTPEAKAGAKDLIDLRNSQMEANQARAESGDQFWEHLSATEENREVNGIVSRFNTNQAALRKLNAQAGALEKEAQALDEQARTYSTSQDIIEQEKAPTAKAQAAEKRAQAEGLRQQASGMQDEMTSIANDASQYPHRLKVVFGENGSVEVNRTATTAQRPSKKGKSSTPTQDDPLNLYQD